MSEREIVEVHKLAKQFGLKTVLRELNFNAREGEFIALLGSNGSGKTTFLRILASLLRPARGRVRVAGYDLPQQAPAVRRKIGFVSHLPLLYGDLTAEENLRFFAKIYAVPEQQKRIGFILDLVGLNAQRRDPVRTYSRGMQQRLAIGRAVLHDPEVILFDEPYTGLDQEACGMLDKVLRQVASLGRTVVMTSHDLVRAAELASRFDVLSAGRIVASVNRDNLSSEGLLGFYRQAISSTAALSDPNAILQ